MKTKKVKITFDPIGLEKLREQYCLLLASNKHDLENLSIGSSVKEHEYFTKFYASTVYHLTELMQLKNVGNDQV